MTPQHTAQYGQFERVSIVFEVFRVRAWATTGRMSRPSATTPAPAIERIKFLREICMLPPQAVTSGCARRPPKHRSVVDLVREAFHHGVALLGVVLHGFLDLRIGPALLPARRRHVL